MLAYATRSQRFVFRIGAVLQYSITLGWLRFCGQFSGRFVVPEGPDDRSQAIYCLEYAEKRRTVPEGRCESGYTTYSPPMVRKRSCRPNHTVPYGTGSLCDTLQAINCLATIIPSLRDKDSQTCPQIRRQITPRGRIRGRRQGQPVRSSFLRSLVGSSVSERSRKNEAPQEWRPNPTSCAIEDGRQPIAMLAFAVECATDRSKSFS